MIYYHQLLIIRQNNNQKSSKNKLKITKQKLAPGIQLYSKLLF